MRKIFNIEIMTPDRQFFSGEIESLVVETTGGSMGVLYNTLPVVSSLKPGVIRIMQKGRWMEAAVGDGILLVDNNKTTVLSSFADWPYEISAAKVRSEIDIERDRLKKEQSLKEYKMAKAQLARQFARLKLKGKSLD